MAEADIKSRFEWLKDYQELHDELVYWQWRQRKAAAEGVRLIDGDLSNKHYVGQVFQRNSDETERCDKHVQYCQQQLKELNELVDSFTGIDNQILKLKYIKGESMEQIADELNYSVDTVKKHHADIHKRLRWLDDFGDVEFQLGKRYDAPTLVDKDVDENTDWAYMPKPKPGAKKVHPSDAPRTSE